MQRTVLNLHDRRSGRSGHQVPNPSPQVGAVPLSVDFLHEARFHKNANLKQSIRKHVINLTEMLFSLIYCTNNAIGVSMKNYIVWGDQKLDFSSSNQSELTYLIFYSVITFNCVVV